MCGRYTLRHPERIPTPADLIREIDERRDDETRALLGPRYNIAPSQRVLIVDRNRDGQRVLRAARWGFRPHWYAGDRKAPINARAETVADRPLFRSAFRRGRCLVPADGWYEWQPQSRGPKVPHFFHRPDDGVFWFAGLAATDAGDGRTMAILTTDANTVARPVHGRMPVVLADDAAADTWTDPDAPGSALEELLRPAPDALFEVHPIGRAVNRPQNDEPALIERDTGRQATGGAT